MHDATHLIRRLRFASELVLVAMACLAPWAFGSVEAWAQLLLASGLLLLTVLQALTGWMSRPSRESRFLSLPSLAMVGLILVALLQAYPLRGGLSGWLGPGIERSRAGLAPGHPQALIDP